MTAEKLDVEQITAAVEAAMKRATQEIIAVLTHTSYTNGAVSQVEADVCPSMWPTEEADIIAHFKERYGWGVPKGSDRTSNPARLISYIKHLGDDTWALFDAEQLLLDAFPNKPPKHVVTIRSLPTVASYLAEECGGADSAGVVRALGKEGLDAFGERCRRRRKQGGDYIAIGHEIITALLGE